MMLVEQVVEFYFDLMDECFELVFVIYYQCYLINIFFEWCLVQLFCMFVYNGEINMLKGNVNWMKSYEICMVLLMFGDKVEDIKLIIFVGVLDLVVLDLVFEVLVCVGCNVLMVKIMLVFEVWFK